MNFAFLIVAFVLAPAARATVLPDVGAVFDRPVVNRCISMLVGENRFGEVERTLVLDRIDRLGVKTYGKARLARLHGFSTELPPPPHAHLPERSRKPSRLSRLIRDLHDPTIDKELHVLRGQTEIASFLDAQKAEQETLDARARAYVGSDFKLGRAAVATGVIAAAAGTGVGYVGLLGGPTLVGALLAGSAMFYHAHVLGDRAQYAYRKLLKTKRGEQPSDWRSEQLEVALGSVRTWTPTTDASTPRFFGVTSVVPDALADALQTARVVEDIPPERFADLYAFRATNQSRWSRLGRDDANFLSADFIFTPGAAPEEHELVVVARLARQHDL